MYTLTDVIGSGLLGLGLGIMLVIFIGVKQRRP